VRTAITPEAGTLKFDAWGIHNVIREVKCKGMGKTLFGDRKSM
jgi:hypothetical protein